MAKIVHFTAFSKNEWNIKATLISVFKWLMDEMYVRGAAGSDEATVNDQEIMFKKVEVILYLKPTSSDIPNKMESLLTI